MIVNFLRRICGHGAVDNSNFPLADPVSLVAWKNRQKDVMPRRLMEIDKHIQCTARNVLDVGAGYGLFSDFARLDGRDVECVEVCIANMAILRSNGYKVYESIRDVNTQYAIVHTNHVIEHVDNPDSFVADLFRCTKRGGVVFVGFPCELPILVLATLARVLSMGIYNPSFYLNAWHVNYWTTRQMQKLLERNGFKIERVWHDNWSWDKTLRSGVKNSLYTLMGLRHSNIIASKP